MRSLIFFILCMLVSLSGCSYFGSSGARAPSGSTVIATPTCSLDASQFDNGINGYCTDRGNQHYSLSFNDDNGTPLLAFDWPELFQNTSEIPEPSVDCTTLCNAGLAEVINTNTNKMNLGVMP